MLRVNSLYHYCHIHINTLFQNISCRPSQVNNPSIAFCNRLQTRQTSGLPGSVVLGDTHVQSAAAVAQVLGGEHGTFLSDEQGTGKC
jgi:hypothetical protein